MLKVQPYFDRGQGDLAQYEYYNFYFLLKTEVKFFSLKKWGSGT